MQLGRYLLVSVALVGCAPSQTATCDYIFFAATNCKEPPRPVLIASRTTTPITSAPPPVARLAVTPVAPSSATPEPTSAPAQPAPDPEIPEINAIYFEVGKSALTPGSKVSLERIATYLKAAPSDTVTLTAFTDPLGSAAKNAELAAERGKSVHQELVTLGVDPSRVKTAAFNLPKDSKFPKDEYWRLRKVVLMYSPETMARVQKLEEQEDQRAENDIVPDSRPAPKAKPTSSGTTASRDPKPEEDGPKLETLDVIYWRSPNHALFILAKKLGYWEEEGFNVRLHESQLEANELSVKLADEVGVQKAIAPKSAMDVKSRRYFLGGVCPYGFHEALQKKLPFVQIGSLLTIPNTVLMKKEMVASTMKDPASFRGTVGRLKNAPTDMQPVYIFTDRLRQVGLKEGVHYSFALYDNQAAMYEALFKGELTAAFSGPPWDMDIVKRHPELGLLPVAGLNQNLPCCRQVVTRENLRRYRAKYVKFERGVIRAQHYLVEHPTEAIELVAKYLKLPSSTVRSILQRPGFQLSANPNTQGQVAWANVMKARVGEGKVGDVREATDNSVFEDAIASLIKDNPSDSIYKSLLTTYNRTK